jgi:transposase
VKFGICLLIRAHLNKIERWWSVLKTWMKQRVKEFETVRECVDEAFKKCPNVYA